MLQSPHAAPAISVLMLAYNHEAYIRQALDSVLSQELEVGFEVLVGEDCSTDLTREIAFEYEARFPGIVKVFAHPRNLGMHANHSFLLGEAQGEFVAYCEGDDYWTSPQKLQRQWEYLQADPDCGLVHANYLNLIHLAGAWRVRTAFRRPQHMANRKGRIYEAMLQSNRIQTCTVLCRLDLLVTGRTTGLNVDEYKVVDWPYFLCLSHDAVIGFIETPLAAYRRTPGSVTNSGAQAAVVRGLDAIRMVDDFCNHFGDPEKVRHDALAAQHGALLSLAFIAGDKPRFESSWQWLEKHAPEGLLGWRVRGMQQLMQWPLASRAWVRLLAMIEAGKHRLEFRREESGV